MENTENVPAENYCNEITDTKNKEITLIDRVDNIISYKYKPKISFTDTDTVLHSNKVILNDLYSNKLILNGKDILSNMKFIEIRFILLFAMIIILFLIK